MKIDHHPLIGSAADLLYAARLLGHLVAYRRGGEMLYVYCSADRAFDEARESQIFVRPALAV